MLTKQDKAWLRKAVRAIVQEELEEVLAEQVQKIGGYDGAVKVEDDDDEEGRGRRSRTIGF